MMAQTDTGSNWFTFVPFAADAHATYTLIPEPDLPSKAAVLHMQGAPFQ
jgi:hypothetical protein